MTKAMKALMAGVAFAGLLAGIAPAAWASIFFLGVSRRERDRCIFFNGNRNHPCDAHL